jgi:hypothetical protein
MERKHKETSWTKAMKVEEKSIREREQGCQTVSFQTKNHNLDKFRRAFQRKMLVYLVTFRDNLRPFGIHNVWPFGVVCGPLAYFFPFW